MAAFTKTIQSQLLAWQDVTTGSVAISSALDVSTLIQASVYAHLARRSGTAFTAGWPNLRIEASAKSSGNDAWHPVTSIQMAVGASIANTTLNGAVSAGATSCVVTAATNIAAGDILLLKGDTDAGNELVRVKSVSGTTVTFEEACTNAHASGNAVTDQAEMYYLSLDLAGIKRLRAVADNAGSGQTFALEVGIITTDSIG